MSEPVPASPYARIQERFGLVPSFFLLAREEPPIMKALFDMAEFAYLDSPLPTLFKERLFTYVSRFCAAPYCMARHCGFLLGRGNVAGDPSAEGIEVEEALQMLRAEFPDVAERDRLLEKLRALPSPLRDWPTPGSPDEALLFQASAVAFVMPAESRDLLSELERLLGTARYDYLALFLCFIRFAHAWTELHPKLAFEDDLEQLLREQRTLADWLSGYRELVSSEVGRQVNLELKELERLREDTEALREANLGLRSAVRDRTRAAKAAEEESRRKSAFIATMSHELRTPLHAILSYADLLHAGVAGPLGEEARGFVERLRRAARHQQQLVEEVLAFARAEGGAEPVSIAPVSVAELASEIEAIVAPLAEAKGLRGRIALHATIAEIHTDPGKLRQVLVNLLGNAVKFTEEGEVALEVRSRGDTVEFTVSDTGIGIPADALDRAFEPFTQLDTSTVRGYGGTGLGLTIASRYVELLGGSIELESEPGRGTSVTVRLPERKGAAAPLPSEDG